MQRFTYAELRNMPEAEHRETLCICMGACNTSVPESQGKYINNEFYCDVCRVCVCCGKPAVMDDGNGLVCSPSRIAKDFDGSDMAVCNGQLNNDEDRQQAEIDQLDWDNGAYNG